MSHGSAGYLIWHVSIKWRAAADRALAPLGLTHAQYVALAELHDLSFGVDKPNQRRLAEVSGLGKAYISKLMRGLEDMGMVRRSADPRDPRAVQLSLTARGVRTVVEAARVAGELEARLLAPLGGSGTTRSSQLIRALGALLGERTD